MGLTSIFHNELIVAFTALFSWSLSGTTHERSTQQGRKENKEDNAASARKGMRIEDELELVESRRPIQPQISANFPRLDRRQYGLQLL